MTTKVRASGTRESRTATPGVGVVRIPRSSKAPLLWEALDLTDVSRHLEAVGNRNFMGLEIETKEDIILAADIGQDGDFRLREVVEFLEQLKGGMATLGRTGKHFESASLFSQQALSYPDELAERAREQRRQSLASGSNPASVAVMPPGKQQEPAKQTNREDQLREWLADPKLREIAKRIITETEGPTKEQGSEVAGETADFSSLTPPMSPTERTEAKTKNRVESSFRNTGHPLIVELASLWDCRETFPRGQFVERFQSLLDQLHNERSLGSFEANRAAVQWINFIAKKQRLILFLGQNAVTLMCNNTVKDGYFAPRQATREAVYLKGLGSKSFPKISVLSRVSS